MPGFDGSGPQGRGAMTGRGFGRCAGAAVPVPPDAGRNAAPKTEDSTQFPQESQETYGLGRGGTACGCGRGNGRGRSRIMNTRQGAWR